MWQKYKEIELSSSEYFSQNYQQADEYRQTLLESLSILTNVINILYNTLGEVPYLFMAFKSLQTTFRTKLIKFYIDMSYDHREISAFILADIITDDNEVRLPPLLGLYTPDFRLYFYSTLNTLTSMGDMYALLIRVLTVVTKEQLTEWADKAFMYYRLAMTYAEGVSFISIFPLYTLEERADLFFYNVRKHFQPAISAAKLIIDLYSVLRSECTLDNSFVQGALSYDEVCLFVGATANKIQVGLKELYYAEDSGLLGSVPSPRENSYVKGLELIKSSLEMSIIRFSTIRRTIGCLNHQTLIPLLQFTLDKQLQHVERYTKTFGAIEDVLQSQVSSFFINDLTELLILHALSSKLNGCTTDFDSFVDSYTNFFTIYSLKDYPNIFFAWILSSFYIYAHFNITSRLEKFLLLVENHLERYRNKPLDYISLNIVHFILGRILSKEGHADKIMVLAQDKEFWDVYSHIHPQFSNYLVFLTSDSQKARHDYLRELMEESVETDYKSYLIPQFEYPKGTDHELLCYLPFNRMRDVLC